MRTIIGANLHRTDYSLPEEIPGRPPEGMPGVLQFVKDRIIAERNRRADQMTEPEREQIMQETISSAEFDAYRQV